MHLFWRERGRREREGGEGERREREGGREEREGGGREMGGRASKVINNQLVHWCELLFFINFI